MSNERGKKKFTCNPPSPLRVKEILKKKNQGAPTPPEQ